MLIYRVEDQDGVGPYSNKKWKAIENGKEIDGNQKLVTAHKNPETHPVFIIWRHSNDFDDKLRKIEKGDLRYGFKSLEDLDTWFRGFHSMLDAAGFKISIYEVTDEDDVVLHENPPNKDGIRQVVFNRCNANLYDGLSLMDIQYYERKNLIAI